MEPPANPTLPFADPAAATAGSADGRDRLNPQQRQAVAHEGGPCLVLAGAGSGKTRVLTHRIAWLIAERDVPPAAICAVTFTNKAAAEMRQRVRQLLGNQPRGLWLSTFHSLGLRLLRRWSGRPGAPREGFLVYDRDASLALWRRCQADLQVSLREFDPGTLMSRCSRAVNRLEDPAAWEENARSYEQRVAARVWKKYRQAKEKANALDFDDLLYRPLRLLRDDADLAAEAHRAFRHILVDEYQDTNRIQYRLVRAMLGDRTELMVVGDEDQSIYHWRGADLDNVLDFQKDFPDATIVRLEQNYRSTQPILAAAGSLVSHNRRRLGKELWTAVEGGDTPVFVPCPTERSEAEHIADRLEELHADGEGEAPVPYCRCAVLYRTNAQSRVLEEVFLSRRIPYKIIGGQRFFSRREVRDVLAWLLLLVRPDDVALRRAVSSPPRGVGEATLRALAEHDPRLSAAAALERLATSDDAADALRQAGCPPGSVEGLQGLVTVLEDLRRLADETSLSGLIRETLTRSGYLDQLADEDDGEERLANLDQLVAAAEEMEGSDGASGPGDRAEDPAAAGEADRGVTTVTAVHGGRGEPESRGLGRLATFLDGIALLGDVDATAGEEEGVRLMTVHAAKGLEFDVVFLTGMEEDLFPHASALADGQLEEERRLCYVGMTRARRRLVLTAARSRRIHGRERWQEPSRFIDEIDPRQLVVRDAPAGGGAGAGVPRRDAAPTERPRIRYDGGRTRPAREDDLQAGTLVVHPMFGPGEVTGAEGSGDRVKLTIRFRRAGKKTVLARYAKLEVPAGE